ncbi:MAG TPA: hypothetical protein VFT87_02815 [Candidatus Saccharimonadales bacterium]|nr:hypothetical protein [Candidatus Saccharimonadales bacterium]
MSVRRQKGFSAVEVVIVAIAVVLIGVIGYLVYQQTTKTMPSASNNTVTSAPTEDDTVAIDEPTYKLTLPAGWQKTTTAPNSYVDELMKAHKSDGSYQYYVHSDGDYFAVSINPSGRGYEANETWQLTNTTTGFKVNSKTTCTPGESFCTPANTNEYRIGMKSGTPLKDHEYFFFAGNSMTKTLVNPDLFQKILESFTVK